MATKLAIDNKPNIFRLISISILMNFQFANTMRYPKITNGT